MHGEFADGATRDDEFDPRGRDFCEYLRLCDEMGRRGGRGGRKRRTFSICASSPVEKFNNSSLLWIKTVPLVSVCAVSRPHVNTATFAFETFLTLPAKIEIES